MNKTTSKEDQDMIPESGLGVLCADAQADGVPCPDQGKECEQCERAVTRRRRDRCDKPS